MYAPPPIPGKKNNTLSIVLISVSAVCILICGIGGFMAFNAGKAAIGTVGPLVACTADLKSIREALVAYDLKNGKLPAAATWMTDVRPFLKQNDAEIKEMENNPVMPIKLMDPAKPWGCKASPEKTYAYAYNIEVAGKKLADVTAANPILVFETDQAPKENLAMKYAMPTSKAEPKIFGQVRDWLTARVTGDIDFDASGPNSNVSGSAN